jgi:hypothetical protein
LHKFHSLLEFLNQALSRELRTGCGAVEVVKVLRKVDWVHLISMLEEERAYFSRFRRSSFNSYLGGGTERGLVILVLVYKRS